jgi:very-short-patch-repair endonuclease
LENKDNIYFAELNQETKQKDINGINNEYRLKTISTVRLPDFYMMDKNIIFEFDGEYWHGVVQIGNRTRDEDRDQEIIATYPNMKIFHVREADFRKDKESVVKDCMEFING